MEGYSRQPSLRAGLMMICPRVLCCSRATRTRELPFHFRNYSERPVAVSSDKSATEALAEAGIRIDTKCFDRIGGVYNPLPEWRCRTSRLRVVGEGEVAKNSSLLLQIGNRERYNPTGLVSHAQVVSQFEL